MRISASFSLVGLLISVLYDRGDRSALSDHLSAVPEHKPASTKRNRLLEQDMGKTEVLCETIGDNRHQFWR